MTPQQVIEGERARRAMLEHLGRRAVLAMDDLAEMKDARPRLEKEMHLPADPNPKGRIYFFSIDGTIKGKRFIGCLFAGECIMVYSDKGFEDANRTAKDGLQETLRIALEIYEEQNRLVVEASPMEKTMIEVGGRRRAAMPHAPDLATDEKLKAMIAHQLGGKPWRG